MRKIRIYYSLITSILFSAILAFLNGCHTSLDHDISNGIQGAFDEKSRSFKWIYYGKDHHYYGHYYQFYKNGYIYEIANFSDKNHEALIYSQNGKLICKRKTFWNSNLFDSTNECTYFYEPIDTDLKVVVYPVKIVLINGHDSANLKIPILELQSMDRSSFLVEKRNDTLLFNRFTSERKDEKFFEYLLKK